MTINFSRGFIFRALIALAVVGIVAVNAVIYYKARSGRTAEDGATAQISANLPAIELIIVNKPDCTECFDIDKLVAPLKDSQVADVRKETRIDYSSPEGAEILRRYEIDKVPTVLVSGDIERLFDLPSFLQNLGRQAEDGTLIVTNVPAPYFEISSGTVRGRFIAYYISKSDCGECYDVKTHRNALTRLSMTPAEEIFVDAGESGGKELISRYRIATLPTIIMTGEMDAYPQLNEVWPTVGTVENDGAYVFRQGQQYMGPYLDLQSGKLVRPAPPAESGEGPAVGQ